MLAIHRVSKNFVLIGLVLTLSATWAWAAEVAHSQEHGAAPASLTLNAGKKWASDEPLRKAMGNIRNAMDASLHDIHGNKLAAAGYDALAKKVNDEVSDIVSNCKLEPKADAQLHLIVADMLSGAAAMQGKGGKVQRRDGALEVLVALGNYGDYFDHPDWKSTKH